VARAGVGAFQKQVVVRVRRHLKVPGRRYTMCAAADQLEKLLPWGLLRMFIFGGGHQISRACGPDNLHPRIAADLPFHVVGLHSGPMPIGNLIAGFVYSDLGHETGVFTPHALYSFRH